MIAYLYYNYGNQIRRLIMKYIFIISIFLFSFLFAADNTAFIKVDGMVCSVNCVGKVNDVVEGIAGVKDVKVDFKKGIATVVYDSDKIGKKAAILAGLKENTRYGVSFLDESSQQL